VTEPYCLQLTVEATTEVFFRGERPDPTAHGLKLSHFINLHLQNNRPLSGCTTPVSDRLIPMPCSDSIKNGFRAGGAAFGQPPPRGAESGQSFSSTNDRLFTFLNVQHMPPTNNYAEQTLRHPVIFRKLIFGNRSERGAHALAVNLSFIHTAKCRQREIIPLLKTLLLSGPRAAAKILFNNSS